MHLSNHTYGSTIDCSIIYAKVIYTIAGATALQSAHFGQGVGPIYLDDVACGGLEIDIFDCTANTMHNCDHTEDAGVMCNFPRMYRHRELEIKHRTIVIDDHISLSQSRS